VNGFPDNQLGARATRDGMFETMKALVIKKDFESHLSGWFVTLRSFFLYFLALVINMIVVINQTRTATSNTAEQMSNSVTQNLRDPERREKMALRKLWFPYPSETYT
jgi:hypothetical protein